MFLSFGSRVIDTLLKVKHFVHYLTIRKKYLSMRFGAFVDSGYVTDSLDMSRMLLPFRWPSVQSMGELIPELPHEVSVHRVKSRMRFKVGKSFSRLAASAALPLSCCFFCTCGGKIENT